jgi:capsular exopolysaccharide synthesis family protein
MFFKMFFRERIEQMSKSANPNLNMEAEVGYGQLLAVLLRRRFWLLSILATSVGATFVITILKQPTYQSTMQLLVEADYQGKHSDDSSNFTDAKVSIDNATQISLLRSSSLLQRAMALLQPSYPTINPNDSDSVASFKKALTVAQVGQEIPSTKKADTKIYQVTYTDHDPMKTQKVLKAMQKVYQEYNLEQQQLRLKRGLDFINRQIPHSKEQVRQSESALEQFRRSQGLIDPTEQGKAKVEMLNRVEKERQTNQVQIQQLRSRYDNLQQQLSLSPQRALSVARLSQSALYQSLLAEIQKTELTLVQQQLRFKDNTPQVQQALDQRQRQLELLQTEVARILGGNTASADGGSLLAQGRLSPSDVTLVNSLVETQVNLQAAEATEQSMRQIQQQLRTELSQFPKLLAEYGRLEPEVNLNRDTLKQLLKAQQDLALEIARGGFAWQVVEEPDLGMKTGPSLPKNLLLGVVVGLMLGGIAALVREAADDVVHSSDELQKQVAIPLLGNLPALAPAAEPSTFLQHLPLYKPPVVEPSMAQILQWRPFREALDLLYQNIQLLNPEQLLKSLVLTSVLASEEQAAVVMGLATSAARFHQRVLLIDMNLRQPSLHQLLNLPNDQGLTTLLSNADPIPAQIFQASNLRSNIAVLTAGPPPADPAKLLSAQRMREVMDSFEQSFDLVLLNAPPVLGMVDAVLAASYCSGTILIGKIGQVTRTDMLQAVAMLRKVNLLGVVTSGSPYVSTASTSSASNSSSTG